MKNRFKNIFKAVSILIIINGLNPHNDVQAQISTSDENKGVISIQQFDTRSLSMGSATVSDLYGRASIGINPALSGLYMKKNVIQANSSFNWNTNLMQHTLTSPTVSIRNHHFTVRAGFINQGSNKLNFFESDQLPDLDVSLYHAETAYAFAFSDAFSMGVLQNVTYTFNNDAKYWTYFTDIGFIYAPAENITYGMVFRGIGHEVNYEIIETSEASVTTLGSNLMQQTLELGATFRFPIEERTFMSLSFSNEKRFGENGIWYKSGLEILPNSLIALRGGVIFHIGNSMFIPRTGFGVNFKYGNLNYMFAPRKVSGEYFHQMGLTIQF